MLVPEDDATDEFDETVTVGGCLLGDGGVRVPGFGVSSAQVELADNDGMSLSAGDVVVREDAGEAVFTLRLSRPSERAVEGWRRPSRTGRRAGGVDYRPDEERMVLGRGETERTLKVGLVDNEAVGESRTFEVAFEAVVGAGEEGAERLEAMATCTIVDDEVADGRGRKLEHALASFGRSVAQDLVAAGRGQAGGGAGADGGDPGRDPLGAVGGGGDRRCGGGGVAAARRRRRRGGGDGRSACVAHAEQLPAPARRLRGRTRWCCGAGAASAGARGGSAPGSGPKERCCPVSWGWSCARERTRCSA